MNQQRGAEPGVVGQAVLGGFTVKGALDYYFSKNVGIGGGYSYTKVTLIRTSTNTLSLTYIYSGPLVYLTLAF